VRREDHVLHPPQRAVRRQRLGVGHVEPGACDAAALQRLDQVVLHDALAAAHVHEERARLDRTEEFRVEHARRRRRQGCCIHHEVRAGGELVQFVRQAHVAHVGRAFPTARADGHDPHAHGMGAPRHLDADAAEPDHEHRLVLERQHLARRRQRARPAAGHALGNVEMQPAGIGEHHGHDVLGHHGSGDALHVGQQDCALAQRRDRDAVLHAGREHLDPADVRARGQQFRRAEAEDGVRTACERDGLGRAASGKQFDAGRDLAQRRDKIRLPVPDDDPGGLAPAAVLPHRQGRLLQPEALDQSRDVCIGGDRLCRR
jgi:hypothetical protein